MEDRQILSKIRRCKKKNKGKSRSGSDVEGDCGHEAFISFGQATMTVTGRRLGLSYGQRYAFAISFVLRGRGFFASSIEWMGT